MRYEVEVVFRKEPVKVSGNKITVGLKESPERGKANVELINKLAKHFGVPPSHVRIISGLTSRNKVVEIEIIDKKP